MRYFPALLFCGFLAACGGVRVAPEGAPPGNRGFLGVIAADEPRATLVGRDVLVSGGNAVDAAAAVAMSLAVTLPSRAGLGGGGVCTVHDAKSNSTEVLDFAPVQAETPMLARGIAALQARYGVRAWTNAVAPAEALARFGFTASKRLADDLAAYGGRLMGDQAALTAFMDRRRQFAAAGTEIRLPHMAETMQVLRMRGPAGIETSQAPGWKNADVKQGAGILLSGPVTTDQAPDASAMMATTGFVVGDKDGMAVACVLSMGAPFGQGRFEPGTGFLIAAAMPDLARARPVIARDASYGHVVLIAAAYGAEAKALADTAAGAWLIEGDGYEQMRTRIQTISSNGANGSLVAALCPTGLGLRGLDCRTMTDIQNYGLGLTFGPEQRQ